MKGPEEKPIEFKYFKDSPRNLILPGYTNRGGELLPHMFIEIFAFPIYPIESDYKYWDEISNIVSTNSIVGLNDVVPCLHSLMFKIPESVHKISYNTFDVKNNMVVTDLVIKTNARYWERSLIDSVTNYAVRKYGSLVNREHDFITVIDRYVKISTHNSWKEQASNYVMVKDGGDSKSLVAVGKAKLKDVYVNEYTMIYMLLKYKFVIKLTNEKTEEYIMNLAYSLFMPDFYEGEYCDSGFKDQMIMGPEKTIDFESLWTSEEMKAVGKENPIVKVRFQISGKFRFKPAKEKTFDLGMTKKIKSMYTELDTSQKDIDDLQRTQEMKYLRTQNMKEQVEKEYVGLKENKNLLSVRKNNLEDQLVHLKRILNDDETLIKEEYGTINYYLIWICEILIFDF